MRLLTLQKHSINFFRTRLRLGGMEIDIPKLTKDFNALVGSWGIDYVYSEKEMSKYFPRIISGTNPGGISHCVPFGDVLTENGWKDIKDIKVGELVYSVDSNRNMVLKPVIDTIETYADELAHVKTKSFEFYCTKEHKIPYFTTPKKNTDSFSLKAFKDLPDEVVVTRAVKWSGGHSKEFFELDDVYFQLKKIIKSPIKKLPYKDYAMLMGWYLSEGYSHLQEKYNPKWKSGRFQISQMKWWNRQEIQDLLDRCGFNWRYTGSEYVVCNSEWARYFKQFGLCDQKFIPDALKNSIHIDTLFDAMMKGDGHWSSDSRGNYTTTSKQLAYDFSEIAIKLGYVVYIDESQPKDRLYRYTVHVRKTDTNGSYFYTRRTRDSRSPNVEYIPHNDKVYCITVADNHTFIIKQGKHSSVTGNSYFKEKFVDAANHLKYGKHQMMKVVFTDNFYQRCIKITRFF
jgi:hypothetical protein